MQLDDKICYCFDVSLRKLVNFARRERPSCASRMSECLGAGTGCGWCIPILKKIHESAVDSASESADVEIDMTPAQYARQRDDYREAGEPNSWTQD